MSFKSTSIKHYFPLVFRGALESMLSNCNEIYKENSGRLKEACIFQLSKIFPKHFESPDQNVYVKNTISKALSIEGIVEQLSLQDIKEIAKIIPSLIDKSASLKKTVLDKMLFIDIKNKVNTIKLTAIISEYEKLLGKKTQNEAEWQDFFRSNMLFFNSSYLDLIEKKNISIKVSIPDFLLIDQFQFVDIFEIKRPDFECLKYDKSHDNYYWSEEASKAISQVEKYIFEMENNANALINAFKEEGVELKIIRPRGFVLISKRSTLINAKCIKSFRVLSSALKNVQVVLYDDFLESIKTKYSLISSEQ